MEASMASSSRVAAGETMRVSSMPALWRAAMDYTCHAPKRAAARAEPRLRAVSCFPPLDLDLRAQLHQPVAGNAEEARGRRGVAVHDRIQLVAPVRHAAVTAGDHGLATGE